MLTRLRIHLNPSTGIAFVALIFAVTGVSFAATDGGIGSHPPGSPAKATASVGHNTTIATAAKSKAKPKAKASPRGPAGPAGKPGVAGVQGPVGPAGPAGTAGAAGKEGPAGKEGAAGAAGTSVTSTALAANAICKAGGSEFKAGSSTTYACNGEKGAAGKNGTFGSEPLPQGQTLKGVYGASGFAEAAYPEPGFGIAASAVSYTVPIPSVGEQALIVHYIKKGEEPLPSGCTGNEAEPGAAENNLCVFAEAEFNSSLPVVNSSAIGFAITGVSQGKGALSINGTWAVTAG
jgi:hypothetical protein